MQCGCPDVMWAEDEKLQSHLEWPKFDFTVIRSIGQLARLNNYSHVTPFTLSFQLIEYIFPVNTAEKLINIICLKFQITQLVCTIRVFWSDRIMIYTYFLTDRETSLIQNIVEYVSHEQ